MKKHKLLQKYRLFIFILLLLVSSLFILSACGDNSEPAASNVSDVNPVDNNSGILSEEDRVLSLVGYGAKGALADTDLSIADMLFYAVQDEYLARAEYAAIIEKFGSQNPYKNIILAEENHISHLKEIFKAYDMQLPEDTSEEHVIVPQNLLEAAQTGVQAEIDNIEMYERFLANDLPQDISDVFLILKNASENHLLAFKKQVNKLQ